MAPWKRILLKSFGVGVGIGVGFAICVASYAWYSSRPKPQTPWNANAITAAFDSTDTNGDDHHLRFLYSLENHTDFDYKIETAILQVTAVVGKDDSLSGAGQVKFQDESLFLPAKQRVLVHLELPAYRYPGSDVLLRDTAEERKRYREAVQNPIIGFLNGQLVVIPKYVNDELPKLKGFAAFDEINRYRINFPNGWRTTKAE